MISIFHGDGTATSRKLFRQQVMQAKEAGHEIRELSGDKLLPKDLETTLATASLFSTETIVIEGLLSRLRSKDKDACVELISKYSGDKNILMWEKKAHTKIAIGKLGKAVVATESKAPTSLFSLLDALVPGNAKNALDLLHDVVRGTEDIIAFTMIARQLSYLIMMKSGTSPKFAPWQMGKLRSQASLWSDKDLENFIAELLSIDFKIKTGTTKLSYSDHLDLLLLTLLR